LRYRFAFLYLQIIAKTAAKTVNKLEVTENLDQGRQPLSPVSCRR